MGTRCPQESHGLCHSIHREGHMLLGHGAGDRSLSLQGCSIWNRLGNPFPAPGLCVPRCPTRRWLLSLTPLLLSPQTRVVRTSLSRWWPKGWRRAGKGSEPTSTYAAAFLRDHADSLWLFTCRGAGWVPWLGLGTSPSPQLQVSQPPLSRHGDTVPFRWGRGWGPRCLLSLDAEAPELWPWAAAENLLKLLVAG